jgi:hypothetical protein
MNEFVEQQPGEIPDIAVETDKEKD